MKLPVKAIISKLNPQTLKSLEESVKICVNKKNQSVDIEHLILSFLNNKESEFYKILMNTKAPLMDFLTAISQSLDMQDKTTSSTPNFSSSLVSLMQNSWLIASVQYNKNYISSGHILITMLRNRGNFVFNFNLKKILSDINLEQIQNEFAKILESEVGSNQNDNHKIKTTNIEKYSVDLVDLAKKQKIDRAIARTTEINQLIDILCRRKQNNPIIIGESGVGKTAIVEELAFAIIEDRVPDKLKNSSIKMLDLASLSAGASVKGEFEDRIKKIIHEIKSSTKTIILFIDEIHNILGAGSGSQGQNDAANLLKPELARGDLKVIGATTWAEYKKFFEKDAALNRRFQVIKAQEPSLEESKKIISNIVPLLEKHHCVQIMENAIDACLKLSIRYLPHLRLPDKAITLLDSACSKICLQHQMFSPSILNIDEEIKILKLDITRLEKNFMDNEGKETLNKKKENLKEKIKLSENLKKIWHQKSDLVKELTSFKLSDKEQYLKQNEKLQNFNNSLKKDYIKQDSDNTEKNFQNKDDSKSIDNNIDTPKTNYKEKNVIQNSVNIYPYVTNETIAEILTGWTNIPINITQSEEEVENLLHLEEKIGKRVIGQNHAVNLISENIRISKANMSDERKPIGVFLLVGESGVGKTETALALAEEIYGHESKIITINMSEYKEPHKIATLIGSPPGYVGYGEGGRLTEAVRKNPYCVILLDEIEKAHTDVQDLFLQVFDKGMLKDSEGVLVDFKNTLIILTSNAGAKKINSFCNKIFNPDIKDKAKDTSNVEGKDTSDVEAKDTSDAKEISLYQLEKLKNIIDVELLNYFKPEFLGRIISIPYISLSNQVLKQIIKIQFQKIGKRLKDFYNSDFKVENNIYDVIVTKVKNSPIGARKIEQMIQNEILPDLSLSLLDLQSQKKSVGMVELGHKLNFFTLNFKKVKKIK